MPEEIKTPTIIRRYYPTLSSIINSDEIPEVLGFIKDGVQSLIDKIHHKDLQFNKSPRGDAAQKIMLEKKEFWKMLSWLRFSFIETTRKDSCGNGVKM
jgi:hypothetical protein